MATHILFLYSCNLSKIYIKPQLFEGYLFRSGVVIYLKFTSNHNNYESLKKFFVVVIYLKFTSNHNLHRILKRNGVVVIYLKFTSNHNG